MKKRNRPVRLEFYVTEHERDLIASKMAQLGTKNMGAYIRKMAIDGYVLRLDLSDVRELIFLLRNATNNLNQIAKRANETGSVFATDIEDMKTHYDRLWEAARGILSVLSEI